MTEKEFMICANELTRRIAGPHDSHESRIDTIETCVLWLLECARQDVREEVGDPTYGVTVEELQDAIEESIDMQYLDPTEAEDLT